VLDQADSPSSIEIKDYLRWPIRDPIHNERVHGLGLHGIKYCNVGVIGVADHSLNTH
jgi:hypothetical protein